MDLDGRRGRDGQGGDVARIRIKREGKLLQQDENEMEKNGMH